MTNSIVQNLKKIYPSSKIVVVADKSFYEIQKCAKGVDEVIPFDRHYTQKGIFARIKFIINFPYKKPFLSICPQKDKTAVLFSKLTGSKKILFQKGDYKYSVIQHHLDLIKTLSNDVKEYHTSFSYKQTNAIEKFNLNKNKKYIALCPYSTKEHKDIPKEVIEELIEIINSKNITPVVLGKINNQNTIKGNCINLLNKTSLFELIDILKLAKLVICCDSGPLHIANSLDIKTFGIFYNKESYEIWKPNEEIYNCKTFLDDKNSKKLINYTKEFLDNSNI